MPEEVGAESRSHRRRLSAVADTPSKSVRYSGQWALFLLLAAPWLLGLGWPDLQSPARARARSPQDAAVVIGIERYTQLPDVPHAHRDADAAHLWLLFTRGVPADRIHRLRDPSSAAVRAALRDAAAKVGPGGTLWITWSGHGVASRDDGRHLLPAREEGIDDADWSVEGLVDLASDTTAGHVLLLVDASFSGQGRDGTALARGRTFVAPPPEPPLDTRIAVWTAASPGQIAGPHDVARQGLFTYLALGALRGWADGVFGPVDGRVTLEEAQTWVRRELERLGRDQTPTLDPRAAARAWVVVDAVEAAPEDLHELRVGAAAEADDEAQAQAAELDVPDVHAQRREVEASLRRQLQDKADRAWQRAWALVVRGEAEEAEEALRWFIATYGSVAYPWQGEELVLSAEQVPRARRLLRDGLDAVGPRIETITLEPARLSLGSPQDTPGRRFDETLHPVRLTRPVAIGVREVDQATWTAVMGDNPSTERDAHLPVTGVSWLDAVRFCNRLSILEGLDPAYEIRGTRVRWLEDATGWRLPTEAEWTLAAGSRRFSGFEATDQACEHANVRDRAHPDGPGGGPLGGFACDDGAAGLGHVGVRQANPRGFHDLTGNAAEWVWDAWQAFGVDEAIDPAPDEPHRTRIVKGGSFHSPPHEARTAARATADLDTTADDLGFRVARTVPVLAEREDEEISGR